MSLKKSLYQEKMKVFVKSDACPRSHIYEKKWTNSNKEKGQKDTLKTTTFHVGQLYIFFLVFLFFIEIEQQIEQLNLKTE